MCLILCQLCEKEISWDGTHECKQEVIKDRIDRLKTENSKLSVRLKRIISATQELLSEVWDFGPDEYVLDAQWLEKLYKAVELEQNSDINNAPDYMAFMIKWGAMFHLYVVVSSLFKRDIYPTKSIEERLEMLREACIRVEILQGHKQLEKTVGELIEELRVAP